MIRMGRGNRSDLPETGDVNREQRPAEPYRYASEVQPPAASRAISESDSMARDIKEGRLSGFVGHGTTLTGETEFHAMLRVDGHLIGTVTSEAGTLIIGTNGQVDANIMVAAAMINGTVNGDVVASEKLQLGRTARVMGNIQSPRLIVEEGAILEGSCSMLKAREVQEEEVAASEYEEQQSLIAPQSEDEPQNSDVAAYMLTSDDDDTADEEEAADAAGV
jgi:cytoskeletal protein CcmA (bactofilin family)